MTPPAQDPQVLTRSGERKVIRPAPHFARAAAMMVGASALFAITSLLANILGRGLYGPPLHPLQVSAGRFFFALAGLAAVGLWLRWRPRREVLAPSRPML